jgi:hypothetical protein
MRHLQKMARDVAQPDRDREKPRVSDGYRRLLADLRDALVADEDDDRIEKLEDRLTDLTEAEDPQLDDEVRVTAAARRRAPDALRLLRPNQLAVYLGAAAEEIGDPQERLVAGLAEVRSAKSDDWETTRDELAEDLGWLLGGLDAARSKAFRAEAAALLTRAHALTEEEYEKQRPGLEKEARQVGADVGPANVLRHAAERTLARLLSNPRLGPVLEARLKGG